MFVIACNCNNSYSTGEIDEGDINAVNRFPITQLALGDLDQEGEYIHYTLGPLVCYNVGKSSSGFLVISFLQPQTN